jgi:hypothetical protein
MSLADQAPDDAAWLSKRLKRSELLDWLTQVNAPRRFDAHTILRALGPDAHGLALRSTEPTGPFLAIISSLGQRVQGSVLCLDVAAIGGVVASRQWIEANGLATRDRSATTVIAAVDGTGADLTGLAQLVDGVVARPDVPSRASWDRAVEPLLRALRSPQLEDSLPADETRGGVSRKDFEERLAQSALADSDLRKRD